MAHLIQLSILHRRCLPANHRGLVLFACLLFLPELMAGSHAHKRIEQSIGAAVQSVQQPGRAGNAAKEEQDIRTLEPGKPIERELAGGQSHAYQITLAEGQYLSVIVEQRGIDVVIKLLGPDDKQIAEFDSEIRKRGQETVTQVAEVAGSYRLYVQAKQKEAPTGRYEIRVMELRAVTEKDRKLQDARRLHAEFRRSYRTGKYDEALQLAEQVLEIREKALGPEHQDVGASLHNLGSLYWVKGDYERAEQLYRRALAIREKALGSEHIDVSGTLTNLGILYFDKGEYNKAEPLYLRALSIREKALGSEHEDVADSLNNLANLHSIKGDYAKAEPLHQRALTIREIVLGSDHPNVANSLNNLALLHRNKGDLTKAEPLYLRALTIFEKALGPGHPYITYPLNNLALLYHDKRDYEKAEPLYLRTLTIQEKALGPEHPMTASSFHNLANLYRDKGDYAKAEPMYLRALAMREKSLGPEHPDVAVSLNQLAILYHFKGDYAKAESMQHRALAIFEKALGAEHPYVATCLSSLALQVEAKGDIAGAVTFRSRATVVGERNIALNIATGSERQKLAYLATISAESERTISLHVHSASNDPTARNLAATTILQRKGRTLDAMADSIATLRQRSSPEAQAMFDQLKGARSQLAMLVLGGPQRNTPTEHQSRIKSLMEQVEKLEAEISRHSEEFRLQSQPITLAAIQSMIPVSSTLIEFFSYRPFKAKSTKPDEAFGKPRYVAYLLRRQGEVQWVELGEKQVIDDDVTALRQALRSPNRADVKQLARALDEKVMRPVRKLLGRTQDVFLSPDGALNLIPFGALVDEHNHYLVENYSFKYLTSGRDLLRLQARTPSRQGPMVVADPQFDLSENAIAGNQAANQNTEARRSMDFTKQIFDPLPSTAVEARTIGGILPGAKVLTGTQATEAAIKRMSGQGILHVATHGFFLADQKPEVANASLGIEERQLLFSEDPLLRSGLILAGANQRQSGAGEDGILTASEAAGLDLWGTKLVVLSACDTGLGEVKNGEGVYGLRRSLVLAGSESQVMSLWKVDDRATRELMVGYYTGLKQGEGRSEALRNVQLKMLRTNNRRHPFYWAGFIQSGEWANLEGKR
jgi:CHAT domain-containing protein/Tfp pilus assembly protein PilF